MTVMDTLNDREQKYGDFGRMAQASQAFKSIARASPAWVAMTAIQREAMEMVLLKTCRILYGDPMHFDSWHDLAGYSMLAVEEFHPRENGSAMKPAANPTEPHQIEQAIAE